MILGGLWLDKVFAMGLKPGQRPGFIGSHEAAITDNVGSEDGGQPALYALFAHGKLLAGEMAV
jgi:hypothetical protein